MQNEELEHLKTLLFSEDDANFDLVFELAKAIDLNSWSVYNELKKCAEFFNLHKKIRPNIRACIRYVQENQFVFNYSNILYFPEYLAVLEPIVKKVKLDNNKLTHIPSIVFAYKQLEELSLRNNNISEINEQIGTLFYLKKLDISNNHLLSETKLEQLKQYLPKATILY